MSEWDAIDRLLDDTAMLDQLAIEMEAVLRELDAVLETPPGDQAVDRDVIEKAKAFINKAAVIFDYVKSRR